MARIIANKFPIDTEARKAVGFGFPLNGDAVFKPTYQTKDQIQANLINYLLTNKSERVFNPNFGANLRELLFENVTESSTDELKQIVQDQIGIFFPMIEVKKIDFQNEPDLNEINFILSYEISLFGIEDNINILLQ
jgi:phage baseplate assembly protein W